MDRSWGLRPGGLGAQGPDVGLLADHTVEAEVLDALMCLTEEDREVTLRHIMYDVDDPILELINEELPK